MINDKKSTLYGIFKLRQNDVKEEIWPGTGNIFVTNGYSQNFRKKHSKPEKSNNDHFFRFVIRLTDLQTFTILLDDPELA